MPAIPSEDYPALFHKATTWGTRRCRFFRFEAAPPLDQISSVKMVPFVGGCALLLNVQHRLGDYLDIPGGTREPDEPYLATVRRELLEEAGARVLTFRLFGGWWCHASDPEPYLPHLPHPDGYVLVGYGDAAIVGTPQNPAGAEQVLAVECLAVDEIVRRFAARTRPELGEVYALAARIRQMDRESQA